MGPEGYHWRVCVEDKPAPGDTSTRKSFSWWDIQDENAVLPVKEASSSQLAKFFAPPREDSVSDTATKAAKGAFKSLGKALAGGNDANADTGPPVRVIAFKLLDLVKVHDDFTHKNHGRGGHIPQAHHHEAPRQQSRQAPRSAPAPRATGYQAPQQQPVRRQPPQQQHRQPARAPAPAPRQPTPQADLMGFGSGPTATPAGRPHVQHSHSMPTAGAVPGETRAEKLKRESEAKKARMQRVWDDVDQRWVEVDPNASKQSSAPIRPGAKKNVGITLDPMNAVNKSANVQAAVNARVNDMKQQQAKALQEVREREAKKKANDDEEDAARKRLEPKIKAWSEEHGKKKQLRAL